jgi:hypothetical protein
VPTVFRIAGYRFFFYSNEGCEPIHIHVEAADGYAKLWLYPISFAEVRGLSSRQRREVRQIVRMHLREIVEAWNDHFRDQT